MVTVWICLNHWTISVVLVFLFFWVGGQKCFAWLHMVLPLVLIQKLVSSMPRYQAGSLFVCSLVVSLRNLKVSLLFPDEICTSGNGGLHTQLWDSVFPQHPVAAKLGEK